jgi:hypothetical protein
MPPQNELLGLKNSGLRAESSQYAARQKSNQPRIKPHEELLLLEAS